jgi:hypothetical protein
MTPPLGGVLFYGQGGVAIGGDQAYTGKPGINAGRWIYHFCGGHRTREAPIIYAVTLFVGGRVDRNEEELRNLSEPLPDEVRRVRDWIVSRHAWTAEVGLDTDLIESRLIDSVEFAEFLFTLEEITGNLIDLASVDLNAFRSLRSIESHFLRRARDAT